MSKRQRRARLHACLIGLAATVAVCGMYAAGWFDRVEWITLDWRFAYASSIPQHPDIVLIDIDDASLDQVGRWPWPRDLQAPLISIPAEQGARRILVDITYVDAEPLRSLAPADADLITDPRSLGPDLLSMALPDLELRAAIEAAGTVYLAFHHPHTDVFRSAAFGRVVDLLVAGDEPAAHGAADALERERAADSGAVELRAFDSGRLTKLLCDSPTLTITECATAFGMEESDWLRRMYPACRAVALARRLQAWFDDEPERWNLAPHKAFAAAYEAITGRLIESVTGLKSNIEGAFALALREVLSYRATTARPIVTGDPPPRAAPEIDAITPVYFLHARAAARCGFVTFEADADGVIRRMRLLQQQGGDTFTQLALGLAADEIGAVSGDFTFPRGRVRIAPGGKAAATRSFQIDRDGYTLAPWVAGTQWREQFEHVPASLVWSIYHRRLLLEANQRAIRAALVELLSDPFFAEHEQHATDVQNLEDVRGQLRLAEYAGDSSLAAALRPMVEQLGGMIAESEVRGVAKLRAAAQSTDDPHVRELLARYRTLEPYYASNAEIERSLDELTTRLHAAVDGRICLIGYTATSLADMKPIPTHPGAPGVMAHANLLNGVLTNRLMRWTTLPTNLLLTVLCGLWATWLTVFRSPRVAVVGIVASIVVLLVLAGWLAFNWWDLWITLTPAIGAMLLTFVAITVFVYIFVDRERRQLSTALGQYTSREIARQISENPELCRRAEVREVTAMFTDLKGFTTISERIGAQRTQAVLNKCLGLFTEVMLQQEALVSKFMGDGVFAFWNPVIYPQADHARRACETAVDLSLALEAFKAQQLRDDGDEAFQELVLRIGVATGNAVVGPCGSEQKYDYTCIGDSVNLAARLESANKAFGTLRLVGGAAKEQAGERFAFRALGALQVKGKIDAAPVFELLGRVDEVDADELAYAQRFGRVVMQFGAREFRGAVEGFEACLAQRPTDRAAELYFQTALAMLGNPPGADWNGAIELTEK